MTCRVALLRMQADGLITLPPSQMASTRRRPHFPPTAATDAQTPLLQPVHQLAALTLRPISAAGASRLWNEYVARYHYLGYTPLSGSQMRYNVFAGDQLVARQLPHHWHQRYGYRPVLLETFVESARHRGTCYKAANWVHVGQTVGRGKKCPVHQQVVPIKDIWLYPLRTDFARVLCR